MIIPMLTCWSMLNELYVRRGRSELESDWLEFRLTTITTLFTETSLY